MPVYPKEQPHIGRPITPGMLQKPVTTSALALPGIAELSRQLPDAIVSILAGFSDLPPRATVEEVYEETEGGTEKQPHLCFEVFDTVPLELFVSCDRTLVSAVTDLVFGGTGIEEPFALSDRPLSGIESSLVALFTDKVRTSLRPLLTGSFNLAEIENREVAGGNRSAAAQRQPHVVFRVLITVLGYDGEMRIGLNRCRLLELASSHGHDEYPDTARAGREEAIFRNARHCLIDVSVTLASETLVVADLMALAPGQVVPLRSAARSTVEVWSEGTFLFPARLMKTGEHLAVRISE